MIYRESLDEGHVRGSMVASHVEWVKRKHPGWMEPLRQLLPEATAQVLDGSIDADGWYPFRTLIELDRGIITLRGGADPATARELGRWSAERNAAPGPETDLHDVFSNAVRFHDRMEDFGSVAYQRLGPGTCRISLLDCGCYSKLHCWSAEGYFEKTAELHGVENVEVVEERCVCEDDVPGCDFVIRWSGD